MIMNDEFRRLQELAGIKEITIGNPVIVKPEDLKEGDKLRITKTVYWGENDTLTTSIPDPLFLGIHGAFANKNDIWEVQKESNSLILRCIQSIEARDIGVMIGPESINLLSELGVLKYENR
jgi:hypothetical protein